MKNKRVIIEGILVISLFALVLVSFTIAWFSATEQVNVDRFTLTVSTSDNFQISLDGVEYSNKLSIVVDNSSITINGEDYTSSVQLEDLAAVLRTYTSTTKADTTYQELDICKPQKDEDGNPLTTNIWTDAIETKIIKDGQTYKLSSSQENTLAQYLELDLWIRSDSDLDIYLGDSSKVYPITTGDDPDVNYVMYSSVDEISYMKIVEYSTAVNADGSLKPYCTLIYDSEDDSGYTYYFTTSRSGTSLVRDFLVKMKTETVTIEDIPIEFINYYDVNNNLLIKSRIITEGISGSEVEYQYFYDVDNQFLFKCKEVLQRDRSYLGREYYDSSNTKIATSAINNTLKTISNDFQTYMAKYTLNSSKFTSNPDFIQTTIQTAKTESIYYNEKGEEVIKIVDVDGVKQYWKGNTKLEGDKIPTKDFEVLTPSYYGLIEETNYDNAFVSNRTAYSFSKNLACGAALVSFSELITDIVQVNTGVGTANVSKEVEDLIYVWNPLPEYKLINDNIYSRFEYDSSREEDTKYYVYNSDTNKYELFNWTESSDLIRTGAITSNTKTVGNGETPLISTKILAGDKYCVKKVRVKLWLDGNDTLSTNSMLNSSKAGNGNFEVCIDLVSNYNKSSIEVEPYVYGGVIQPNKYLIKAHKDNNEATSYTFNVTGDWATIGGYTYAYARIEQLTDNTALLTFDYYQKVVVSATDSSNRTVSVTVENSFAKLIYEPIEGETNKYKVTAIEFWADPEFYNPEEDIVDTGTWRITDENIAKLTKDEYGNAIIEFIGSGSLRINYYQVFYMGSAQYINQVYADISHTYVEVSK